jgi:hypothetical protein
MTRALLRASRCRRRLLNRKIPNACPWCGEPLRPPAYIQVRPTRAIATPHKKPPSCGVCTKGEPPSRAKKRWFEVWVCAHSCFHVKSWPSAPCLLFFYECMPKGVSRFDWCVRANASLCLHAHTHLLLLIRTRAHLLIQKSAIHMPIQAIHMPTQAIHMPTQAIHMPTQAIDSRAKSHFDH